MLLEQAFGNGWQGPGCFSQAMRAAEASTHFASGKCKVDPGDVWDAVRESRKPQNQAKESEKEGGEILLSGAALRSHCPSDSFRRKPAGKLE